MLGAKKNILTHTFSHCNINNSSDLILVIYELKVTWNFSSPSNIMISLPYLSIKSIIKSFLNY